MTDPSDEDTTHPPEAVTLLSQTDILAALRASATELDPAHMGVFASMTVARWLSGADLATDLMVEHCRYHQRRSRGGRRAHSAAIHALLDGTNQAQVIAGLAWTLLAYELLPVQRQRGT